MVNLICFFITAEFTLFSCLFYSPLIQNSRLKSLGKSSILYLFLVSVLLLCIVDTANSST
ncbi:hypothetical protein [Wolbachia endosymbiont (group B) of Ennomos erosarius]|uniref:hypothetical protein n=1 Tax=Wolbachia endosymbiont (group B) of Ennomos erosarius TaxID=3066175 RepID=UPI003132C161